MFYFLCILGILGLAAAQNERQVAVLLSGLERGFFEHAGYETWSRHFLQPLKEAGARITMIMCVEVGAYSDPGNVTNSASNYSTNKPTPKLLSDLGIKMIQYLEAGRYERLKKCSELLYSHRNFDSFHLSEFLGIHIIL